MGNVRRLALLAMVAACDAASESRPCTIVCSVAGACPSEMACGVDGYCHAADDDVDCSGPAEPLDAPVVELPDAAVVEPAPDAIAACAGGDLSEVYGGHCYLMFSAPKDWNAALAHCGDFDAHLVAVEDGNENAFLKLTFVGTREVWMGSTDFGSEGTWRWVTGVPWTFVAWDPSEPNNLDNQENCGSFKAARSLAVWNDSRCWWSYPYICEREY
jgi:hypothetical protein